MNFCFKIRTGWPETRFCEAAGFQGEEAGLANQAGREPENIPSRGGNACFLFVIFLRTCSAPNLRTYGISTAAHGGADTVNVCLYDSLLDIL